MVWFVSSVKTFLGWFGLSDQLQEVVAGCSELEKGKTLQQNKMSCGSWGEEETNFFILIIIIATTKWICSFIILHSFKL